MGINFFNSLNRIGQKNNLSLLNREEIDIIPTSWVEKIIFYYRVERIRLGLSH